MSHSPQPKTCVYLYFTALSKRYQPPVRYKYNVYPSCQTAVILIGVYIFLSISHVQQIFAAGRFELDFSETVIIYIFG